jgi:hypothetical protein
MAAIHLNPMYYLKHAWDATHSMWGKLTIILFYVFIWFQIIWAVQVIVAPTWGYECYFSSLSDYAAWMVRTTCRYANVFVIGFYLYADRGGIKLWNVAMVFLVNGAGTWAWMANSSQLMSMHGAPKTTCSSQMGMILFWSTLGWSLLALICAFMESRSERASRGTNEERAPLV